MIQEITKEEFIAYEKVRTSGKTNMFDLNYVCRLSKLSPDKARTIMMNYGDLMEKYPDVRQ